MKRFNQEFNWVADFESSWDCCEFVSVKLCGLYNTGVLYKKCVNEPYACFCRQGILIEGTYADYIIKGKGTKTSLWICNK